MKLHRNDPSDVDIYRTFKVQNFLNGNNHGNHECSKDIFLSDCYETSQEWSLGFVEVHSGFEIFRMAIVNF
jgi:hypothetical protein